MFIGELIRSWRELNNLRHANDKKYGLRQVAKQIGIGHATLARIECGEAADSETMHKLFIWLLSGNVTPEVHEWVKVGAPNYFTACRKCQIIQRADGKNKPCKGFVKLRPMEKPFDLEPTESPTHD